MAASTIERSIVIARGKQIITHGIALLRDAGVSAEEIATIVFAGAMEAGSTSAAPVSQPVSSASSVAGDIATEPAKKRSPGRPKKERDPDAPKHPGNPAFLEAIARAKKWYEEEYMPTWESKKDEWEEIYNRIPVKKDAKRERKAFPKDKPISVQMAQSIYKMLHAPSAEDAAAKKEAKKAAAKKAKETKKSAPAAPAATAPAAPVTAAGGAGSDNSEDTEMYSLELDGQKYIYDDMNQTWFMNEDGSKGEWAGIYDPANDTLDDTAKEPVA